MEQALKATRNLLKVTRKQHSYIFRNSAVHVECDDGDDNDPPSGVAGVSENSCKNSIAATPNVRLVEEVGLSMASPVRSKGVPTSRYSPCDFPIRSFCDQST